MPSLTGIHFPDIAFISRRGDVALVSRSQLCLPRKLVFFRAKRDSALNGPVHEEHGSAPVNVVENFPHLPDTERQAVDVPVPATPRYRSSDSKKLEAVLRVSEPGPSGSLPPHVLYLLELGFDLEQIKVIAKRYPHFANYSLEGKIRPLVEFLLDLGVSKSDLPNILTKSPRLCGMKLSDNLNPSMDFLETLGVDRSEWAKLILKFPSLPTYSRKNLEATFRFFSEMGVSEEGLGKILTLRPRVISYSVEERLRPSAAYIQSLGVDVAKLLRRYPIIFTLSIENCLKPSTEFFLENGFSLEEVGTMLSKFGGLYTYNLERNVIPKWNFFLTTDYSRQDLVDHPRYFGYSLEGRIKPRYYLMKKFGVKLSLSELLIRNRDDFRALLVKKKIEKLQADKSCSLSDAN